MSIKEQPDDRLAECQRQANELIDARNRTIGFLEAEIERLRKRQPAQPDNGGGE